MLLKNVRFLVTQNQSREILENKDVLIENGEISEIGESIKTEEETLDCSEKLVLPGLINLHTHVPMNLFRGLSDNKNLQNWLQEDIFPAEEKLTEEDVYYGALNALMEMLRTGTTCFNDMYFFEEKVAEATEEFGMRAVLSRALVSVDDKGDKRLKESEAFLKKYQNHDLITPAVAPHSVYTVSKEYLKKARDQAEEFDASIHIHISETEKENKDCMEEHDKTPTEYLNSLGILEENTIGAHGVWLSENDINILKETGSGIVHCPCSNLKLGSGIADISDYMDQELQVGLGTDGAASNNNLNLFEEAKFASLVQKKDDPESLTGQQVLDMLTIEGARILGLDKEIGSIEEGKKADLITVDLNDSSMSPYYGKQGMVSNLVFSFSGMVSDSIINGELKLRDKKLIGFKQSEIKRETKGLVSKFAD